MPTQKRRASDGLRENGESQGGTEDTWKKRKTNRNKRVKWTHEIVECLLQDLVDLAMDGRQTDNCGFKAVDLRMVAQTLNQKHGTSFQDRTLQNKLADLKRYWKIWIAHTKHCSGWNRVDGGSLQADDEAEADHFQSHPECKVFQRKLPDHYSQLEQLFGSKVATGDRVTSIDELADSTDEHDVVPAAPLLSEDEDGQVIGKDLGLSDDGQYENDEGVGISVEQPFEALGADLPSSGPFLTPLDRGRNTSKATRSSRPSASRARSSGSSSSRSTSARAYHVAPLQVDWKPIESILQEFAA